MEPYTRDLLKRYVEAGLAEIGEHTYGEPVIRYAQLGHRFICGRYCSFGPGIQIMLGGEHRHDWVTTYPFPAFAEAWPEAAGLTGHHRGRGNVTVGNDVWVGMSAYIGSGISIGDGAVIAARSVVTKDVPPYAIVGGNPAQLIRYRFAPDVIDRLLEIRWWDWPEERVRTHVPLLLSGDVAAFIQAAMAEQMTPVTERG